MLVKSTFVPGVMEVYKNGKRKKLTELTNNLLSREANPSAPILKIDVPNNPNLLYRLLLRLVGIHDKTQAPDRNFSKKF